MSEMQKLGVTDLISEIKHVENYADFEKLAFQHSLQGFLVKNIEVESMEVNNLNHILLKWVCCVNNS